MMMGPVSSCAPAGTGAPKGTPNRSEENVHLQCKYCNQWEGGAQYAYSKFLGEDKSDELVRLSRTIYKLSDAEFEDIYYYYKEKVEELEKTKDFI